MLRSKSATDMDGLRKTALAPNTCPSSTMKLGARRLREGDATVFGSD
jgi:hypothetical protein